MQNKLSRACGSLLFFLGVLSFLGCLALIVPSAVKSGSALLIALLAFLGLGCFALRYLIEDRHEKVVRTTFSAMVSPETLRHVQEHTEPFRLSGKKASATVFFSDVDGFAKISEKLSVEDLATTLNEYLSSMSAIIMRYGGYIDKYVGDAIMAVFGVPTPDEKEPDSHAWKCCWAALDQQAEIDRIRDSFRKQHGLHLVVHMGINSGEVCAGNLGSQMRFQYTVLGAAVNRAARFVSANRAFGTRIIIGEQTYSLAMEKVEARFLGLVIQKGVSEPLKIFELLARKGGLPEEKRRLVQLFEEGWNLHSVRKFEEAIRLFDQCLALDPSDRPSKVYRDLCHRYLQAAPPEHWRGEWIQVAS